MQKAKVAFFGTSDRSTPILEALKDNFDLKICFTKTDSKVGRKQERKETGVKSWCKQNEIKLFEIRSLKEQEAYIVNLLLEDRVLVGLVADFSFIITEKIINTPPKKLINIHFSLLPKYRGASPVQHAILAGEAKTGVTYYLMDKNMDTGDILYAFDHIIFPTDTSLSLNKALFEKAAQKLPEVLNSYLSNKLTPIKQDNLNATYCWSKTNPKTTMIQKDDARIDWDLTPQQIERSIRAFFPWPIAWTTLREINKNNKLAPFPKIKPNINPNLKLKIFSARLENDALIPIEIQVEGKNKTDWRSFLNGYCKN